MQNAPCFQVHQLIQPSDLELSKERQPRREAGKPQRLLHTQRVRERVSQFVREGQTHLLSRSYSGHTSGEGI